MTKIKSLSKEINERIARQCLLVLLDDDGSSMRDWLEEEFGASHLQVASGQVGESFHTGSDKWTRKINIRSGQESGSDHGRCGV